MGDDTNVEMTDAPPAATSMTAAGAPTPGGWGDLALAGTTPGSWAAEVEVEHEASGHNASALEREREKAKKRAERFNTEYKAPAARTVAHGLMSRKDVLAMRREEAEKRTRGGGGGFVTGIDLFDPEEERKRTARASKFGAMLTALTPEEAAARVADDVARAATAETLRRRREKFGIEDGAGDQMMANVDRGDMLEERVDPEVDAAWRSDAVHLYGVDHMTTGECMSYFGDYGPVFCEWINDSSCNIVFADEHTARRAIRMKGDAMGTGANPDEKGALPEGTDAGMLWHSGPEVRHKSGKTLQLSFRLATEDDVKPDGKIRSRYLWLSQKDKPKKRRRGGGGGGDPSGDPSGGDRSGDRVNGKQKRRRGGGGGGMRGFDDDNDGGLGDLRARLQKTKEEEVAGDGAGMDVAGDNADGLAAVDDVTAMEGDDEPSERPILMGGDAGGVAARAVAAAAASAAATRVTSAPSLQEPAPPIGDLPEDDLRKKLARGGAGGGAGPQDEARGGSGAGAGVIDADKDGVRVGDDTTEGATGGDDADDDDAKMAEETKQ